MDNGGIWPGDEYYFESLKEKSYEERIKELTKELKEARAEIGRLKNLVIDCTDWNWLDEDAFDTIPENITDATDAIVKERLNIGGRKGQAMSDTPRSFNHCDCGDGKSRCFNCLFELSCQLERELAGARAALDALGLEVGQAIVLRSVDFSAEDVEPRTHAIWAAMRETIKERDEARAEIERKDALIEQMRETLEFVKRRHYVNDDDNWYSCPVSGPCTDDNAGTCCNCGADRVNAIIKAALSAAERITS